MLIIDSRRIKAMEIWQEIIKDFNLDPTEMQNLWDEIALNDDLFHELIFFLENRTFKDEIKCLGYSMTDLYMWLMARSNLMIDYGRNDNRINKDVLVLQTFEMMTHMLKEPDKYARLLSDDIGLGMDQHIMEY